MAGRKQYLLPIDPGVWADVERWAADICAASTLRWSGTCAKQSVGAAGISARDGVSPAGSAGRLARGQGGAPSGAEAAATLHAGIAVG